MKKNYLAAILMVFSSFLAAQTGNVGIDTPSPASKLTVNGNTSIGSGYTGIAAPANGAIIQGNVGINTSAPHSTLDLGVSGGASVTDPLAKKLAVWNNPVGDNFYGFGISPSTLQFHAGATQNQAPDMVLVAGGNVGIGTSVPAAKVDVIGKVKITDGTQGANRIFVSDANGVGSWRDPAQTKEIMVLVNSAYQTVLAGVPAGASTPLTNFVQSVNTIPGAVFNPNNDSYILPQGVYEVTVSFEIDRALGACPPAGFLINSYFMVFPDNGGILGVHSNAPSSCGFFGIHSALWVTTFTVPAGGAGQFITIGRGQGGNYVDSALLSPNSRIVFKKIL
jgi:hypothetical protein